MDGKPADRMLVIKPYESVQQLKKALAKKKSIKSTAELEISRHYDDETMEYYFEIKFLR